MVGKRLNKISSNNTEKRYLAFISYRHADNKEPGRQWATWLHQALESYEVPDDLVGTTNERGNIIPERLFPIFRDEDELPAHSDLASAITRALDETSVLVVLCSPAAAASQYVCEEIDYFKKLGNSSQIIAAILYGEPNTSLDEAKQRDGFIVEDECFPKPLQFQYDEQAMPTNQRAEPIAADFRVNIKGINYQGWTNPTAFNEYLRRNTELSLSERELKVSEYKEQLNLMFLKLVASILGVPLGQLTQRDKAYQLKQEKLKAKRLRRWLSVVGALAVLAAATALYAFNLSQVAESREYAARANLLLKTDPLSSIQLSIQSYEKNQTEEAKKAIRNIAAASPLLKTLSAVDDKLHKVVFSNNDKDILANTYSTTYLWKDGLVKDLKGSFNAHPSGRPRLSANQKRLALSTEKVFKVLETKNWTEVGRGFGEWFSSEFFSLDQNGKRLAILGLPQSRTENRSAKEIQFDNLQLEVWDVQSNKRLSSKAVSAEAVLFANNGTTLLLVQDRIVGYGVTRRTLSTVGIYDADSLTLLAERPIAYSNYIDTQSILRVSPDRTLVANVTREGSIEVWQARTGKRIGLIEKNGFRSVNWSPNGQELVTTNGSDTLSIWSSDNLYRIKEIRSNYSRLDDAQYSADGRQLIGTTIGGGATSVWSRRTGELLDTFSGDDFKGGTLGVSTDGLKLVKTSKNRVQELQAGKKSVRVLEKLPNGEIEKIQWSDSEKSLYTVSGKTVLRAKPDSIDTYEVWFESNSFNVEQVQLGSSQKGNHLLFLTRELSQKSNNEPSQYESKICLVSISDGELQNCISQNEIHEVKWSNDFTRLAVIYENGAKLFDTKGSDFELVMEWKGDAQLAFFGLSSDLAVWSFWDDEILPSGKLPAEINVYEVNLGIAPTLFNDQFITSDNEIWQTQNRQGEIDALAFPFSILDSYRKGEFLATDNTGKFIAAEFLSNSKHNTKVGIWSAANNKLIKTIEGYGPFEFSPDGKLLVFWNQLDDTPFEIVKVHSVETGELQASIKIDSGVVDLEFINSNQQLAILAKDGKTYVYSSAYFRPISELIDKLKISTM